MKKTAVALLALSAASSAFAYDFHGFYLGGDLGQTQYHKSVALEALGTNSNADADLTKKANKEDRDSKGTAYGLHLGYHFNHFFSVEAAWTKFANNTYVFKNGTNSDKKSHAANAFDVQAKLNYMSPFNVNFTLGAGVAAVRNSIPADFFRYYTDKNKFKTWRAAPVVSAGVEYYFTPSFSVGVQAKAFVNTFKAKNTAENGYGLYTADRVHNNQSVYKPTVLFFSGNLTYHYGQAKVEPVVEIVTTKFAVKSEALFKTSSYQLNMSKASEALADVVAAYNADKEATLKVVGHADRTGNAAKNLLLSRQRAVSVANYLIEKGVKKENITWDGVGSAEPVTDGCYNVKNRAALRACLAPDRRVDVYITGRKSKTVKQYY